MKWIKTVIGVVIAISMLSFIIIGINNTSEKTISFEIIEVDDNMITTNNNNLHNKLLSISEVKNNTVINIKSVKLNNDEVFNYSEYERLTIYNNEIYYGGSGVYDWYLPEGNFINSEGYQAQVGDLWTITVTDPKLPTSTILLLGLIPIIYITSIITYAYKKDNLTE